jgi:hypothetical protein
MSARLLMIGLDGADGRILDQASRDGTLPNLGALRARGRAWALSSARSATDDALWASFQYGAGVGEHGRYSYRLKADQNQPDFAVKRELHRELFWDGLSQQKFRVAVFDIPKCRPPLPLNGIHLVDWLVHGRYNKSPLSYPETLAGEVMDHFGKPLPSLCSYQPPVLSDDDVRAVCDHLLTSVSQKRTAGLHYLSSEPWDLFLIGFKEAHCSCHMFWEFADPRHAKHDVERVVRLGNPILDVLKAQDAAIGELIAAAGAGADILVFSTSDFIPNGTILHLMPQIVERVNRYIADSANQPGSADLTPACEALFTSDNAAGLRVHHDRSDDAERHARRLDLIATLVRELVDVDDRDPVVSGVTRPSFEHTGKLAATLPDLLLHFNANTCPRAVTSARLGLIEASPPENIRSGNHEAGGFVLAAGPSAGVAEAEVRSMEDFAALTAKILGADPGAQPIDPTGEGRYRNFTPV